MLAQSFATSCRDWWLCIHASEVDERDLSAIFAASQFVRWLNEYAWDLGNPGAHEAFNSGFRPVEYSQFVSSVVFIVDGSDHCVLCNKGLRV